MPLMNNPNSSKAPKHTRHEASAGTRNAPGPFIGIVKNNIDPLRSGRLQVYIAELGGDIEDSANWRTVAYCSPFYGVTGALSPERQSGGQDFASSPQSYGMWFVPPDVGVQVMCIFVNGVADKGYWFGCIPDWPNLHMVPGLSSASWHGGGPDPVVDFNSTGSATDGSFFSQAKTKHTYQSEIWTKQGLLQDKIRGPGTSSAFRESPSRVFGISTPGPEVTYPSGIDTGGNADLSIRERRGGHQFVMDDGDAQGDSQLIRLRTSGGNMILLNDTAGIVYIINGAGSAWFEMDNTGNIRAFSQAKIELHATAGFTFETPGPISMSGSTIDIAATGALKMSGSTVDVSGKKGVKVGGEGELHLSGSKSYLSGKKCVGITGKDHIDMKAGCITFNTKKVTEAKAPAAASPGKGPTKEPYTGHLNSKTTSPSTSASYGSANGLTDGAAGNYGASASFGLTADVPNYLGTSTNATGPIKFNPGLQGSFSGQASNQGDASSLSVYDQYSVLYSDLILSSVNNTGFAIDVSSGSADMTDLSPGEAQNNPGDLATLGSDPFAIGQNNGLNVYSTPEDGIAALTLLLDLIQTDGAATITDFITEYINKKAKTK